MNEPRPKRKPTRLKGHDYSRPGWYFVTVCTLNRERCLSEVVGRGLLDAPRIRLTPYGEWTEEALRFLDAQSEYIRVDKYVIMPNHIHVLLEVKPGGASGKPRPTNALVPKFFSSLKRYTDRQAGRPIWQTTYYDHIVRDEEDYQRIWSYIETNPAKWEEDPYYAP